MTEVTTLSPEVIAAIAAAVQAAKPAKKAKGEKKARTPLTEDQKAERRAKVDAETLEKFVGAGYKNVIPRTTVRTYEGWITEGRHVKKGQKSIKCGSWPLFHLDQTEPLKVGGTVH